MPMTVVRSSRDTSRSSELKGETFTGQVWMDPVFLDENMTINNVMFTPCARTHWHNHEKGQVLIVKAGSGWVCEKGGSPQKLHVGDLVYCPADTTHWHGGDDGSYMLHTAISYGKTTWYDAVDESTYKSKQ